MLSSSFLCDPGGMNSTQVPVAYFIIQGLDSLGDIQTALFVIFLVAYIIILGGNSMIIFLVCTQKMIFMNKILLRSFDGDMFDIIIFVCFYFSLYSLSKQCFLP